MAARKDFTGLQVNGWTVIAKAPAQNRVPYWTARHDQCGVTTDLPHVSLGRALDSKGFLAPCLSCNGDKLQDVGITHGMHIACGAAHGVGTPCPTTADPEPSMDVELPFDDDPRRAVPGNELTALEAVNGRAIEDVRLPEAAPWADSPEQLIAIGMLDLDAHRDEDEQPDFDLDRLELHDAAAGTTVIRGRVDRLEAPQDILDVIRGAIAGHQRSLQTAVGASELGGCERRLAGRIIYGKAEERDIDGRWRPQVGTWVHDGLGPVFVEHNRKNNNPPRWLTDHRVKAGPIPGSLDLYDALLYRVIDFKVTGQTTRDRAVRGNIDDRYEVQVDTYALGLESEGFRVDRVALLMLPASGSLSESVWYERGYNRDRAITAIGRYQALKAKADLASTLPEAQADALRRSIVEQAEPTEDHCPRCPLFGGLCAGAMRRAEPALTLVGA